jgi:aminobenzoyl-glutamate utilization protein B
VITKGGEAPNVVPDDAEVWYFVRAPKRHQVESIYNRLINVAKGATLMTGTEMDIQLKSATYNVQFNSVVQEIMNSNLKSVGPPNFDKKDLEFAKKLRESLPPDAMEGYLRFVPDKLLKIAKAVISQPLNKLIIPPIGEDQVSPGSTDVSDVSWVVPLGEVNIACEVMGSPGHSWQNVATAGMDIGHKGMLTAAKILAASTIDFMKNNDLVRKAWKQFNKDHEDQKYSSPFPKDFNLLIDEIKR